MRSSPWLALLVACGGSTAEAPAPGPSALEADPAEGARPGSAAPADSALAACVAEPLALDAGAKAAAKPAGPGSRGPRDEPPVTHPDDCLRSPERERCLASLALDLREAGQPLGALRIARDLALGARDREAGTLAAHVELESLNEIGVHAFPARPSCYDVMARDVGPLRDRYCACEPDPASPERAALCDTLARIELDLDRLTADRVATSADRDAAQATYATAADAYFNAFQRHCDARCGAAPDATEQLARRCDEIAYNAYRAARAARDDRRAERALRALLDPTRGLDKSPLAEKVRGELAQRPGDGQPSSSPSSR